MTPTQLALHNPVLFAQVFARYYAYRLLPGLTGWNRALAPVERQVFRHISAARFEIDTRELGDSNGVRQMVWGSYEIYLQNVLRMVLRPGDTFMDVGANAGFFSLYAASLVGPGGLVHSFEPALRYFRVLENNARINPGLRIVTNNLAISDHPGEAIFYPAAPSHSGGSSLEVGWLSGSHRDPEERVQIITLTDYVAEKGLQPRLIKIDVEGHEVPAIRGLMPWLAAAPVKPFIICEASSFNSQTQITALLGAAGYVFHDIYRPRRRLGALSALGALDLFAVPPGTADW
jgi:FkbM family methyltransferase